MAAVGLVLLLAAEAHAYTLTITGEVRGLSDKEVRLTCPAWLDEMRTPISADGKYAFEITYPYPAMFTAYYGAGDSLMTIDFFAFGDLAAGVPLADEVADFGERLLGGFLVLLDVFLGLGTGREQQPGEEASDGQEAVRSHESLRGWGRLSG